MNQGHTQVTVPKLPNCDIHKYRYGNPNLPAKYDGRTTADSPGQGSWANMCQDCFDNFGVGLGLGRGQELILADPSEFN